MRTVQTRYNGLFSISDWASEKTALVLKKEKRKEKRWIRLRVGDILPDATVKLRLVGQNGADRPITASRDCFLDNESRSEMMEDDLKQKDSERLHLTPGETL